jgi:Predicted glycosyltransferases
LGADDIPSQIVIVDQSTEQKNREQIKYLVESYKTVIQIIYLYQELPSLTKARNNAIKEAVYDIIICSDDDIDVYNDTLHNLFTLAQNPQIAMMAAIDINSLKKSSYLSYLCGTKSFKNRKIGHVTLSMLGRYPDKIIGEIETQWAMGYFFVIRKSLIETWKLSWDEKLTGYAYAEDLDFSYRYYNKAKENGMRCILSDKIRVSHLVSNEYRTPSKTSTYMYVINRAYLSYKHHMGLKSLFAMGWCDFWKLIQRILKNENIIDLISAKKYNKMLKKLDYQGKMYYGD